MVTLMIAHAATSKLHDLQDLENGVATLGFRGEALSSLSEVSTIELVTRIRGSPNTYKKVIKVSDFEISSILI